MSFIEAVNSCMRQYAGFDGRAIRSEFWFFWLFGFLIGIAANLVDPRGGVAGLISLALLVPSLAVGARRLHDTGRSGWWQLLVFLPIIGWIVLIVWWATRGEPVANRYGPPPPESLGQLSDNPPPAPRPVGAGSVGGEERLPCPRCGESIPAAARVCRFCNYELRAQE